MYCSSSQPGHRTLVTRRPRLLARQRDGGVSLVPGVDYIDQALAPRIPLRLLTGQLQCPLEVLRAGSRYMRRDQQVGRLPEWMPRRQRFRGFAKTLQPGQTITTRIYDAGGGAYAYETTSDDGAVVIKDGLAQIRS